MLAIPRDLSNRQARKEKIVGIFDNIPQFTQTFAIKINFTMGERFAFVTDKEINLLVDKVVPEKTKNSTSYAVNVFDGKLFVNVSPNL